RVSAVVPMVGWTDLQQALYPNGAINYRYGLGHFYSGLEFTNGGPPFFNYDRLMFDMFDAGAEGHMPDQKVLDALAARSIATMDADGRLKLKQSRRPQVPTFIIQSWDDYIFPAQQALDIYSEITADKQLYLGRTGHPPGGNSYDGEEVYVATQVLRWFNRYLVGIGGKESKTITSAPSQFSGNLFTGNDLTNVEPFSIYLKPKGVMSKKRKSKDRFETLGGIFRPQQIRSSRAGAEVPSKADMFSGTVEAVEPLPKALVYTFAPWQSRTELLGLSEFDLHVSSPTSSTFDVAVRTFDVAPDGTETEISVGVMRVKDVRPGEVRRVRFRDFGDHWVFREGHSLRLKLTNIDFPDFRPPGVNDNRASQVTVHYGRVFPSSLKIPIKRN
ncbi:MAG TPA: CocE/NonD family hydrolase C-terminal non-catalytic domain-containing protein, partial [Blastocatellia bacterium]|nr:CocE/NonD family hydrolase C-terminal non-catalytic domain-containing protein [Blastocatellia bacterium]